MLLAWRLAFTSSRCVVPALSYLCVFTSVPALLLPASRPHLSLLPAAQRERGKVWLEQLVPLATLCATAADWNRNWPIHVSLQAGSGPCLVLTDYLISIQTARVSAPLLRSLEKRPWPASFFKAPRALLSSPISCLNYALFCVLVVFFPFFPPAPPPFFFC